jgi:preprotein translocase subunit SecB
MSIINNIEESAKSVLKMKGIYVDNFSFKRFSFDEFVNSDPVVNVSREIQKIGENQYKVVLQIILSENDFYKLDITVVGLFAFEDNNKLDDETKSIFIFKNAVAILFPFLRSEVILLTSQPGFIPVIIPPINILELFKNSNEQPYE